MSMIDTSSWEEDFRREDALEVDQTNQADAYQEDEGFWSSFGDIAMAPIRGIAGAAEGIYSLADTLAFDLLPDAEENFGLGGSETFAGAAIETIVQFGVGFLAPGVGGLSVASKLGKLSKVSKMVDAGNKAVKANMAAGKKVPALLMARGMEAGKYAVAGAVADFTVFQGHEQRLSNLIQEVPALQNPVTEFLAADEEDPELVGRLKAAIEGAGLGIMVDSVLIGIRAVRAGVKAGGGDKKAATIAFEQRQKELMLEEAEAVTNKVSQDITDEASQEMDRLFDIDEDPLPLGQKLDEDAPKKPATYEDDYPVKRGVEAMQSRINREASQGELTQDEALFANNFLSRMSQKGELEKTGIRFRTNKNFGGKGVAGQFNPFKKVITVATQTVRDGGFKRTFVHEIWHAVEKQIDPAHIKAMRRDLHKARKAFAKKYGVDYDKMFNGKTGGAKREFLKFVDKKGISKKEFYRLTDVNEWLAENMADVTLTRLDLEDDTKRLIGFLRFQFRNLLTEIKTVFGKGTYDKIARGFLEGTYTAPRKSVPDMLDASTMARSGRQVSYDIDPRSADDLQDVLLNPENRGGNQQMLGEAVDARVRERLAQGADDLAESQRRVEESSAPHRRETQAEFDASVGRELSETQAAARQAIHDAEFLDEAAGTRLTELEQQMKDMSETSEEARQVLIKHRAQLGAMREVLTAAGRKMSELVGKKNSELTSRDVAEFLIQQQNYKTLANNVRATQSEIGRNLQSIQRPTGEGLSGEISTSIAEDAIPNRFSLDNLEDEETVNYIIDMAGGLDRALEEVTKFRVTWDGGNGNLSGALGVARGKAGLTGALTEWWMNSILSGPTTMIVNGASGVATTLLAPLERSVGLALTGRLEEAGVEFGRLLNIPNEIRDSLRGAGAAMKSGEGQLENVGSRADERAASGGQIERLIDDKFGGRRARTHTGEIEFLSDEDSVAVAASKWMARNVINAPGKLLLGTDEFFKQLNYRTAVRAELYKQAMRDRAISPSQYDNYVEANYTRIVGDGQRMSREKFIKEANRKFPQTVDNYITKRHTYINKQMRRFSPIAERALAQARENTFTTPLSADRGALSGVGKTVSDTVIKYPPLRLVLPFVRTPTNIIQFVMDRVPVAGQISRSNNTRGYLGKEFAGFRSELLSSNPDIRADAVGRLATGTLFFSGAAMAAMNGGITGGGPADRNQRRIKEQTGWQPYSIKVGDSYISYRRLDPFASFFGIAADLVDIMTHGDEEQRTEAGDIALGAMMAISKNITSKTYLKGIQDLSGILFEPEMTVKGFANRTISSFLIPNIAAQTARAGEGNFTDIQNLTDALKARIPGLSAEVPPRRNMFGDPIQDNGVNVPVDLVNPFSYSTVKDDKIMTELDQIGHGFTSPRSLKGGVELRDYYNSRNQSAYDRWQEIASQTKIQGRTLKQEITKLMKSAKYKRLPYKSLDGIDRSPRARLIQSILNKYRAKAFSEMLREFPEVRERNEITKMIKGRRTAGRDYQDLLALIED